MKITDTTNHTRRVVTTIDAEELQRLAIAAVAAQAGVDVGGPGFSGRAYATRRDTSTGIQYDMVVEISIDLTCLPREM